MKGIIREGRHEDIATIVEYNFNLAKETEHIELNLDKLYKGVQRIIEDRSKGIYFIYEEDGKVLGQLMVTKEWSDWRNGEFWWIQSVYVHKEHRQKGIFKSLYKHVENMVLENGELCGLRLYVEKENYTAQNTYHSLGMDETYYKLYEMVKQKL